MMVYLYNSGLKSTFKKFLSSLDLQGLFGSAHFQKLTQNIFDFMPLWQNQLGQQFPNLHFFQILAYCAHGLVNGTLQNTFISYLYDFLCPQLFLQTSSLQVSSIDT